MLKINLDRPINELILNHHSTPFSNNYHFFRLELASDYWIFSKST